MNSKKAKEKKILVVLGSPRKKGNSAILAEKITEGAKSKGVRVEQVFLHSMNISPCNGCWVCQQSDKEGCVIDDDMQSIYQRLIEADVWVIASPVFAFNMSAQTKIFLDRLFSFGGYKENPIVGKKIAIAMSYGDTDPLMSGCINALHTFQDCFRYAGAEIVGIVHGSALKAGEIKANKTLMLAAKELGKKLTNF
jgi:multimeric flavodoxin WrbA